MSDPAIVPVPVINKFPLLCRVIWPVAARLFAFTTDEVNNVKAPAFVLPPVIMLAAVNWKFPATEEALRVTDAAVSDMTTLPATPAMLPTLAESVPALVLPMVTLPKPEERLRTGVDTRVPAACVTLPEPFAESATLEAPVTSAFTFMLELFALVCSITLFAEMGPFTLTLPADVAVRSPVAARETPELTETAAARPPEVVMYTGPPFRFSVAIDPEAPAELANVIG